ncbi:NUDIX hydrolase [Nocardioides terrisoli]|uniref:NUDIX hydrolase n=1 Tax=Nocardioides terrisoli TaxID=3388267 RepID=UPI00287B949E|nr:NUDIX domain-containing protein [Nocardioides marmorisolisilvae]
MSRFTVVPAAYVYLRRDGEVLLQLRQDTGYMDGHWAAAAAGHVERGETAYDAARREAAEELGLTDLVLAFELTMQRTQGPGPDAAFDPIEERVDFFFSCTSWSGDPRIMEPDKCAELRWFGLDDLPDTVVPHERLALQRLGSGGGYATFGFDRAGSGTRT